MYCSIIERKFWFPSPFFSHFERKHCKLACSGKVCSSNDWQSCKSNIPFFSSLDEKRKSFLFVRFVYQRGFLIFPFEHILFLGDIIRRDTDFYLAAGCFISWFVK